VAGGEEEWEESGIASVAIASIADADAGVADVDVVANASYIVADAAVSAAISSLPSPSFVVATCSVELACL